MDRIGADNRDEILSYRRIKSYHRNQLVREVELLDHQIETLDRILYDMEV